MKTPGMNPECRAAQSSRLADWAVIGLLALVVVANVAVTTVSLLNL